MAKIYPGDRQAAVARVLLSIVGPERAAEIQTRTLPPHFEVPEDVAVEYQRLVAESNRSAAVVLDSDVDPALTPPDEDEGPDKGDEKSPVAPVEETPKETPKETSKTPPAVEEPKETKSTTTKATPASKSGK